MRLYAPLSPAMQYRVFGNRKIRNSEVDDLFLTIIHWSLCSKRVSPNEESGCCDSRHRGRLGDQEEEKKVEIARSADWTSPDGDIVGLKPEALCVMLSICSCIVCFGLSSLDSVRQDGRRCQPMKDRKMSSIVILPTRRRSKEMQKGAPWLQLRLRPRYSANLTRLGTNFGTRIWHR